MRHAMSSSPSPAPPGPPWSSHTCFRFFAAPTTRFKKKVAFWPRGSFQSSGTSTCAHSASRPSVPVNIGQGTNAIPCGVGLSGSGCAAGGGAGSGKGAGASICALHAEKKIDETRSANPK
jgi:hypothetical protein